MDESAPRERAIRYIPQFDGLRAFAVIAVVGSHYDATHEWFTWGGLGVELFFVLSGFLITTILLRARAAVTARAQTVGEAAIRFYIRRFLRIFPIYYVTLAVVAIVGIAPFRETLWWHVTYLSNVYFAIRGSWHGPVSHLWSLAVEEQFYLMWPWVILLTPQRLLRPVVVGAIVLGPVSRGILLVAGAPRVAVETLVFTTFDLLGFGALLALELPHWTARKTSRLKWALAIGMTAAVALILIPGVDWKLELLLGRTARAAVFGWIVFGASRGFRGPAGAILTWPPISYVGKISYAIYLFHTFAAELTAKIFHYAFAMELPTGSLPNTVTGAAATLAAAAISWRYFEGPINRFKERFHGARAAAGSPG